MRGVVGGILAVLWLWCAVGVCASGQEVRRERGSRFIVSVGDEMPRMSFVTSEGDSIDSDFLLGRVVVIDFCASWCPFSPSQMWYHERVLMERYRDVADFMMYVVCEDEGEGRAAFAGIVREEGITIPVVYDEGERLYGLFMTPRGSVTRTVVVGPDGRIAHLEDGHTRGGLRRIRRCVRGLVRGMGE